MEEYVESPLGWLRVFGTSDFVNGLEFTGGKSGGSKGFGEVAKAAEQLREYFGGLRKQFDLKVSAEGTDFQKKVWKKLRQIPYGMTASYGDVADDLGMGGAARAVGNANGKNPIPIIVPCHRVVASEGKLGGYSSGVGRKEWLLLYEGGV